MFLFVTLLYLVIKEKIEQMWVVGPYIVWVAVIKTLFWASVGYLGEWVIILGDWGWVGGLWGIILGGWS